MDFINKDWLVIASFVILIVSVLVLYFAGGVRALRKYVAIMLIIGFGLMVLGSRL